MSGYPLPRPLSSPEDAVRFRHADLAAFGEDALWQEWQLVRAALAQLGRQQRETFIETGEGPVPAKQWLQVRLAAVAAEMETARRMP